MDHPIQQHANRLRSFVFGLCILAAGFLLLATGKNIVKSTAAESWPVRPGVLVQGEKKGRSLLYGGGWLKYSYEVDGKKYQGTRIGYGISNTDELVLNNAEQRVYVNPDDHTDAVLVVGFKKSHFFGLVFASIFVWLGFYLWRRV